MPDGDPGGTAATPGGPAGSPTAGAASGLRPADHAADGGIRRFEFATATRIVFGPGTSGEIGAIARGFGRRALVVTGSAPRRFPKVLESLGAAGVSVETFPVPGEPTTLHVAAGVARARLRGTDVVIGLGGGSAIDAAKAIAGLLTNERDLFDYLEVIGRGEPMNRPAAPWVAVPTTAGAGAEVTRNAVLTSREHKVKASLRSPHLLARVAVVDPDLTLDLPAAVTAATGLDALTQLIEPFLSRRANPMTDALCLEGLARIARSLRRACQDGGDREARGDMCFAALLGGIALANAGLGAVHGLAAPLGGSFPAPHGAVCAALLPHAMAVNLGVLTGRAAPDGALERVHTIARRLTQSDEARAEDGIAWIQELTHGLGIPALRTYGVGPEHFPTLVEQARQASSMKTNPVELTRDEIATILKRAW